MKLRAISIAAGAVAAVAFAIPQSASASLVYDAAIQASAQGFGNAPRDLTLQATGQDTFESGGLAVSPTGTIVFKDLRVRGLWLSKRLQSAPRDVIDALYRGLDELSVSGLLVAKIDSVFRADDIKSAVRRASQPGIDGKVIVTFN